MNKMNEDELFGCDKAEQPETIVIDYGGANVAKPLHVGHLRSAVIGESIKRTARYLGSKSFLLSTIVARSVVLYNVAPFDFRIIHGGISLVSVSSCTSTTSAP